MFQHIEVALQLFYCLIMHKRIYIIYIKRELRLYLVHEHTQLVTGGTVNIPVPISGL